MVYHTALLFCLLLVDYLMSVNSNGKVCAVQVTLQASIVHVQSVNYSLLLLHSHWQTFLCIAMEMPLCSRWVHLVALLSIQKLKAE